MVSVLSKVPIEPISVEVDNAAREALMAANLKIQNSLQICDLDYILHLARLFILTSETDYPNAKDICFTSFHMRQTDSKGITH